MENGGALHLSNKSDVSFEGNSTVLFVSNRATQSGGVTYSITVCSISFNGISNTAFLNNTVFYVVEECIWKV